MPFHLATEPPRSRASRGWAHAVRNGQQAATAVCGLPLAPLTDWTDIPFRGLPWDDAYCPACTDVVMRDAGEGPPNGPLPDLPG